LLDSPDIGIRSYLIAEIRKGWRTHSKQYG